MKFQGYFQNLDHKKAFELLYFIAGLYSMYLIWGFLLEKITTSVYSNQDSEAYFKINCGMIFIQKIIVYLCAVLYAKLTIPKQKRIHIPHKNGATLGLLLYIGQITYFSSITMVSYPFVIMFKSCGVLNVILIAVFCTRLKTKQLKLGKQKIKIAISVTLGLILFRICDPNFNLNQTNYQLFGIFLLLLSLFSDGFVADLQAEIVQKFKLAPIQIVVTFNKFGTLFSLIHLIFSGQIPQLVNFMFSYPNFAFDALCFSLTGFFGQVFIYKIVAKYKQHMVPLLMATRRLITIVLSIIYFEHQTSFGQIIGMSIVFFIVIYELYDSIRIRREKEQAIENRPKNIQKQIQMIQVKFVEGLQDSKNSTSLRSPFLVKDLDKVKDRSIENN